MSVYRTIGPLVINDLSDDIIDVSAPILYDTKISHLQHQNLSYSKILIKLMSFVVGGVYQLILINQRS